MPFAYNLMPPCSRKPRNTLHQEPRSIAKSKHDAQQPIQSINYLGRDPTFAAASTTLDPIGIYTGRPSSLKKATLAPSLIVDVFEVERVDISGDVPETNKQSGRRV